MDEKIDILTEETQRKKRPLNTAMVLGLMIFLFLLQVFPPLWTNDVTSLRHFFVALFDIVGLGYLFYEVISRRKDSTNTLRGNPLHLLPIRIWLCLLLWMGVSIFWALNPIEGIVVWNRWILVFVCSCILIMLLTNKRKLIHVIVFSAMAVALVNVLTCIISYYYLDCATYPKRIPSINGGYGNKNIFAVCLMCKLPLLYYALLRYKRVWKWVAGFLILGICFCLPIISTRSAFVCMGLNMFILLVYSLLHFFRFKRGNYLVSTGLIIALMLGGFVLGSVFVTYNYNHGDKKQSNEFDVTQRIKETGTGKSSQIRLIIWRNTSKIIKEKPLTGWGIGNHKLAIMKVETPQKGNFIVSDHAHNDFLEMFSELGIVGLLLYIGLYGTMAVLGLRLIFSRRTKQAHRLLALVSLMLLLTYMNDALFNFPNERATVQIYLALSIAIMGYVYLCNRRKESRVGWKLILPMVLVILPATVIEAMHFESSKLQLERIVCYNSKNKNKIPASYWERHFPCMPNVDESTKPIAMSVANMYALEGNHRKAVDILLKDNSNPYLAMKELTLASWYSRLGMNDSAVFYADKCLSMKPKLYNAAVVKFNVAHKEGDREKMKAILYDFLQNKDSMNYRPWCDLMNVYINEKDYESALKVWEKGHKTVPRSMKIFNKKAEIDSLQTINQNI